MLFIVMIVLAGAQLSPTGLGATSWFGVWTLNIPKSTDASGASAFKRGTCTIEPWADGVQFTYDLVRPRGGITHLEWRGRIDGRDYPVAGVEAAVTTAYTTIDDRTYSVVQKADGMVTATARMRLSPDGKSITTVTTTTNPQGQTVTSTTVFDRR